MYIYLLFVFIRKDLIVVVSLLACLYKSTGVAIVLFPALMLASAAALVLTKFLKFYSKVFKVLDLVYIWYDYSCWTKILLSTVHNPVYDLEVKVTEILC